MTVDREQIRRDAEYVKGTLAGYCLALLAELEQAEQNEQDAQKVAFLLAKHTKQVVDALKVCEAELIRPTFIDGAAFLAWGQAHKALCDYEREGT